MPTRLDSLPAALDSILPQVDQFHLFLHGFDEIPDIARHPKVTAYPMPRSHPYRASGKFYGLKHVTEPCLYFCFDDDIIYGRRYVEHMRAVLATLPRSAAVGVHALLFDKPGSGFFAQKRLTFRRPLVGTRKVDAVGTGTLAFRSDTIRIEPAEWLFGDMDDIMFAQQATLQGVALYAAEHYGSLLQAIAVGQPDSLAVSGHKDSTRQDAEMRRLIAMKASATTR